MAASNKTIEHIGHILVQELGAKKAREIVYRLIAEVEGNSSFETTIQKLGNYLNKAKDSYTSKRFHGSEARDSIGE